MALGRVLRDGLGEGAGGYLVDHHAGLVVVDAAEDEIDAACWRAAAGSAQAVHEGGEAVHGGDVERVTLHVAKVAEVAEVSAWTDCETETGGRSGRSTSSAVSGLMSLSVSTAASVFVIPACEVTRGLVSGSYGVLLLSGGWEWRQVLACSGRKNNLFMFANSTVS